MTPQGQTLGQGARGVTAGAGQRWVTFDCYGTLIDWESGMRAAVGSVAPSSSEDRLLAAYHEIEPELEGATPFLAYRRVLTEALRLAAEREGIELPEGGERVFAETLPDWPIFPDTVPALEALRRDGWKLGILSNVDRDLLGGTLDRTLPVTFDAAVTAEDVESYKPGLAHFERFAADHCADPGSWVHVGCSVFHDMEPATRIGVPGVLIDRDGRFREAGGAVAVLMDLSGLPVALGGVMAKGSLARRE
jgi:2-haloacid dehalogenase